MPSKYDKSIKIEARKLRKQGKSIKDIAVILVVPYTTVQKWVKNVKVSSKAKITIRQQAAGKNFHLMKKICKLRKSGKSFSEISNILKIDRITAFRYAKDIQITEKQQNTINERTHPGISKYTYNEELFKNPSELTYYILGVFITDGCIDKRLSSANLCVKDLKWLTDIKNIICPEKPIHNDKNRTTYALHIHNKCIINWLIANQCIPAKSLIVKMPNIPQKHLSHFVRGVIDGDGLVGYYGTSFQVQIFSGSKRFIRALSQIIKNIGINNSITMYKRENRNIEYRLNFFGVNATKLCNYIYSNKNIFLDRKFDKYQEYLSFKDTLITN